MGPCMASAAARPMASVVFWKERVRLISVSKASNQTEYGSDTYLGFDHLGNVIFQCGLNSGHLSSNGVAQMTNDRLEAL